MPEDIKLQKAEDGKGLSTHDYTEEAKAKVDAIPENPEYTDTVYTHPESHPASMITQDSARRMVSDTQIAAWDSKASGTHTHDYSPTGHTHDSVQTAQGNTLKFSRLTQAQYDALGTKDANTLYLIVG